MTRPRVHVFGSPEGGFEDHSSRFCDQHETPGNDVETVYHCEVIAAGDGWVCETCLESTDGEEEQ